MELTAMRFKDYTWPYNPERCRCVWERKLLRRKLPFGGVSLQDLGRWSRTFEGEGCFFGAGAYEEFRALEALFREEGAGLLTHPQWGTVRARFASLELSQEPLPDFVRYRFVFWEEDEGTGGFRRIAGSGGSGGAGASQVRREPVYYTVRKGDSLWAIAKGRGVTLADLIALNPRSGTPTGSIPERR